MKSGFKILTKVAHSMEALTLNAASRMNLLLSSRHIAGTVTTQRIRDGSGGLEVQSNLWR